MLEFHPVEIADRQWIAPLLAAEQLPLCTYTFTPLFCWQHVYGHEVCRLEDRLLVRVSGEEGYAYFWPAGRGDETPALRALEEDARQNNCGEFRLLTLLPDYLPKLEALYGGRMEIKNTPDSYDYLYDINRLADLPGKKLHAKRNHINRFRENHPGWSYAPLTVADIPDCLELDRKWYQEHLDANGGERDESVYMDRAAMVTALNYFQALGMDGGVLRDGTGDVLAFTLGTRLTDTIFDVNFERARSDVQGSFPVINQEFSRWIRSAYPEIAFIDREEDMGHPGLRRAKQSYYPDRMTENVSVSISL